jgi:hypothetical protein
MKQDSAFLEAVHRNNYLWRNRRRMAWGAFVSIIVVTGLCFFWVDVERLEKLETVITWFYMAMASIVGAYMGFATYASVANKDVMYGDLYGPGPGHSHGEEPPPPDSSITPDNPDEEPPPRRRRAPKVGFE